MDLMQDEERNTWTIHTKYMRFAGGLFWASLILLLLTLLQGAQGDFSFLWYLALVYLIIICRSWKQSIPRILDGGECFWIPPGWLHAYGSLRLPRRSFSYFIIPTQFGICVCLHCMTSTIFLLTSTYAIRLATLAASLSMFRAALASVLRSPVILWYYTYGYVHPGQSWYLPYQYLCRRILSRFSKDQDTLDTQISMTLYQVGSIFVLNLAISQYFGLVPLHIQFRYLNGKYLWYLTIQVLHDLLGSSLSSILSHISALFSHLCLCFIGSS